MRLAGELKRLGVIKKVKVVGKSGKVLDFYVDIKKALGSPRAFKLICEKMCRIIDGKATCIAGSGLGGLPLATAISLRLDLPFVLVRDEVKKHGLQNKINGYIPTKKDKVVIVDDVFTTGTCISNVAQALAATNAEVIGGCVVVDRGDASKFKIPIKSLLLSKDLTS